MNIEPSPTHPGNPARNSGALLLSAAFLWQVYVVIHAIRSTSTLKTLLEGLGVTQLPHITTAYLASYRLFFLLPLVTLVLLIAVARTKHVTYWWPTAATFIGLLLGLVLQAWTTEAFFAPLSSLISQVG